MMLSSPARRVVSHAGAVLVALVAASPAAAVVIAYEGFDYAPGALVGQGAADASWAGAWLESGANQGTGASLVADSLTYTDSMGASLQTSGGHLMATGMSGTLVSVARDLATTHGTPDTSTWWSLIGKRLANRPTPAENLSRAASVQLHDVGSTPLERIAIGKGTHAVATADGFPNWGMLHSGAVANQVSTTDSILEQAFLVARIDHLGDALTPDNVYLWVNPLLGTAPDINAPDASFIGALDFTFDRLRIFAGQATGGNPYAEMVVDEVRLGTTYADVAPIAGPGGADPDFNGDQQVDGADFLIWQRGLGLTGQTSNANGDADADGTVDGDDLVVWRTGFASATPTVGAVPEPASWGIALVAAGLLASQRRRTL